MTKTPSKQDVDRIRQQSGARKVALSRIKTILEMYRQGRSASSCMDEIARAMKAVK
jgi:hypothetical protein